MMEIEEKTVNADGTVEAFIVKADAGDLCRLCANTDNQLIPIYRGEGLEHHISVKIEKHLPIIKVTEVDKLPLQICYQCASTLISWHNLYEGCLVADKRLREILAIDEKLCPEDESFGDYVDDYRDNYDDDTHETLPTSTNSSNVEANTSKDNSTVIPILSDTKVLNETDLEASDERCLRWSDCDSGDDNYDNYDDDDDDCHNDYDYEYYYNDDDNRLTKVASSSKPNRNKSRGRRRDAIPGISETNALSSRLIADEGSAAIGTIDICDCVLSRDRCRRCARFDRFKCYFCPMVFLKLDERNRHLRVSHRAKLLENSFELFCKAGQKGPDGEAGNQPETRYECDKCADEFSDKVALIEHLKLHRNFDRKDDHGRDLDANWWSDENNDHIESIDRPNASSVLPRRPTKRTRPTRASSSQKKSSPVSSGDQSTYECAHCADISLSKVDIAKHLNLIHGFNPHQTPHQCPPQTTKKQITELIGELAKKSFKKTDANLATDSSSISSAAGYYICAVCGQIFLKRHSFTRHVNQHSSSRFDCDKCKKSFTTKAALISHQNLKHKDLPKNMFFLNGRKYLKCDQCSFTCRNERNKMEEHMRVHTGEKPFTCELCGKQFRTRALLRVHTRYVHEGVKEHACDLCGRCFSNKRYMEEHRRIHTGEKPLICDLCGKTFRQNSSLTKHVENHLGIKRHGCHLCGKRFSNSHHLSIHIKRHMGEANFVCDQCGKGFVDQYQLKNHQVVHSEERPFVCSICGTGFKLLKHLKQHGRTHRTS